MRSTLLAVAVAILTIATFERVTTFSFVNYDDYEFVIDNPPIAGGFSRASVTWAFTHPYDAAGGPLTWLSHMADVERAGLDPGSHHVTSLALHTCTAVLLFLVLARMTNAPGRSAVVAALFAVHPLHVESVAWVSARKDVLSGLFWMLGMAAYARYVRHPRWSAYLLVMAMVVAGLLSKPMVATLPAVLLLLDVWPTGRLSTSDRLTQHWRAAILDKIPLLAICVAAAVFTLLAQQRIGAVMDTAALPLSTRLSNAVKLGLPRKDGAARRVSPTRTDERSAVEAGAHLVSGSRWSPSDSGGAPARWAGWYSSPGAGDRSDTGRWSWQRIGRRIAAIGLHHRQLGRRRTL